MERGRFIVFEGADGSGKSTQAQMLYKHIKNSLGEDKCILTAEPTTGHFGRLCRDIGAGRIKAEADTQALLYAADRIEHIQLLLPELEKGKYVICDRYYISSLAYQSVSADYENVIAYNRVPMKLLRPDITIFTDVSLETCEKRRKLRAGADDIYELSEFAKKVHFMYGVVLERLAGSENIVVINGENGMADIFEDILGVLREKLSLPA